MLAGRRRSLARNRCRSRCPQQAPALRLSGSAHRPTEPGLRFGTARCRTASSGRPRGVGDIRRTAATHPSAYSNSINRLPGDRGSSGHSGRARRGLRASLRGFHERVAPASPQSVPASPDPRGCAELSSRLAQEPHDRPPGKTRHPREVTHLRPAGQGAGHRARTP